MDYSAKVVVATHKKYRMPEDPLYLPLQVGAALKKDENGHPVDFGYTRDDTGDNISRLNPSFCELTGLYWAWKNLKADYIGLAHYRRHFSLHGRHGFEHVLTYSELRPYLGRVRVFVPTRRRYYIETLYSHYEHTHYASHLDETRVILSEKYPDYLDSYDRVIRQTWGYMFNMMIMDYSLFNEYCTWLFDILFELRRRMEKQLESQELDAFQKRLYGRVSEIIFNVWLDHKLRSGDLRPKELKEIPVINMERVNWFKKGTAFLEAKFTHKKYTGSF